MKNEETIPSMLSPLHEDRRPAAPAKTPAGLKVVLYLLAFAALLALLRH
jgi:hypothetical protein